MPKDNALPDMPAPVAKPKRTETLHAAYDKNGNDSYSFADVVVFGTKLEAYEYAMGQDPTWKVATITKGQRLSEVV